MAIGKLTIAKIKAAPRGSFLNDGGGLYLQTEKTGTQSWVFRFKREGRDRKTGLGSIDTVDLQEAREKARECRKLVAEGGDPVVDKRQRRNQTRLINNMTFRRAAETFIAEYEPGWSVTNTMQWRRLFESYVYPKVGELPVAAVNSRAILLDEILAPLWQTIPASANRLRAHLAKVIGWAAFKGYCGADYRGENMARWKDNLEHGLPRPTALRPVRHYTGDAVP